jgi:hypothetical protein
MYPCRGIEYDACMGTSKVRAPHEHVSTGEYRFVPLRNQDTHIPLAIPRAWRWHSLGRALGDVDVRGLMSMLPGWWQTEPLVYKEARLAGVPFFLTQPDNLAVASRAIDTALMNVVVIEFKRAAGFVSDLREHRDTLPSLWVTVELLGEALSPLPYPALGKNARREIHVAPGVPILTQCAFLCGSSPSLFHTSDTFTVAYEQDATRISSGEDFIPAITGFRVPRVLPRAGVCECGGEIVSL